LHFFGDVRFCHLTGVKLTSDGGQLSTKLKEPFFWPQTKKNRPYYKHCEVGYYRMSNVFSWRMGRGQMEVLNKRVDRGERCMNFLIYSRYKVSLFYTVQIPIILLIIG
jgi:hypothetical protein